LISATFFAFASIDVRDALVAVKNASQFRKANACPVGVEPAGAFGKSETETCSNAAPVFRLITQTLFVLAHATYNRDPSGERAIELGCSPVATERRSFKLPASNSTTFDPPHKDT
jgi:hypothetical protein